METGCGFTSGDNFWFKNRSRNGFVRKKSCNGIYNQLLFAISAIQILWISKKLGNADVFDALALFPAHLLLVRWVPAITCCSRSADVYILRLLFIIYWYHKTALRFL